LSKTLFQQGLGALATPLIDPVFIAHRIGYENRRAGRTGRKGDAPVMIQPTATAAPGVAPDPALQDFLEAFRLRRIWLRLSWMDIRLRYRRSYLGPLWLTIQAAVFILAVGTIFGLVLQGLKADYLPYFALGYIIWGFVAAAVLESCELFQQSQQYILHMRLPYPLWLFQLIFRNLLILLHMVPIYVAIALFYQLAPGWHLIMLPIGLVLLLVNVAWACLVLAVVCLRYRDLSRLMQSAVPVAFLATPIIWTADSLGEHTYIAEVNPIYHLIEIVRAPLLGQAAAPLSWAVTLAMAGIGWWLALTLYRRARQRIAFWL
jgi:lipopolysaccharide transport system permease protein